MNTRNHPRAEVINPFLSATVDVLSLMASEDARPGRPSLKNKGDGTAGDVTGIIGLASTSLRGAFSVSFQRETIVGVVTAMLGEPPEEGSDDLMDAVGEITNQISGSVRAQLDKIGYNFEMAIPQIICGRGHEVYGLDDAPCVLIPFETRYGSFTVEFSLKQA